jgi:hypothetical protein
MAFETIPLVGGAANAHQTQSVQLGDNFLEFRINYITRFKCWSVDISREGASLASGAMLAPGADIIATHNADIGRLLFVGDEATLDNLGQSNSLIWSDV